MSDQSWDEQFKQFLRKTGDDVRKASEDVRAEAQKLLEAAMDPEKQQRVRDRLNELGLWARKSAQGVAGAMAEAASKAETAFHGATDKMTGPAAPGKTPKVQAVPSSAPRKPAAKSKAKAKPRKAPSKSGAKRKR